MRSSKGAGRMREASERRNCSVVGGMEASDRAGMMCAPGTIGVLRVLARGQSGQESAGWESVWRALGQEGFREAWRER